MVMNLKLTPMPIARSGALAALAGTALTAALPSRAFGAAAQSIHLACLSIDSGSGLYAAQDAGFFSRAGINVTVDAGNANGTAVAAQLVSGSLDVGDMAVLALVAAHEKGLPLTIVGLGQVFLPTAPTNLLLVASDSPLRNPRDLVGKTIGVNVLGGIGFLAMTAWLEANGVDPKSVHFLEIPFPVMPAALQTHRIDAADVAEPVLGAAKHTARAFGNIFEGIGPTFLISCWVANADWAARNPDLVRTFSKAIRDGSAWANAHHDQSAEFAAKRINIPASDIRATTRAIFATGNGVALVQTLVDSAVKHGQISHPVDAATLFCKDAVV
jgi:NitT/TauT family transport system substrate-binding protein